MTSTPWPSMPPGADKFTGLLCVLGEEYASLMRERDLLRQQQQRRRSCDVRLEPVGGADVPSALMCCPGNQLKDGTSITFAAVEAYTPPTSEYEGETRPVPLDIGMASSPPTCPAVLGDVDLDEGVLPVADAHSQSVHKGVEPLQLHTLWLDLYVANQLQVDVFASEGPLNVRRESASFKRSNALELMGYAGLTTAAGDLRNRIVQWIHSDVYFLPHNRLRIAWDAIGVCLVMHDVIVIPIQIAWNVDPNINVVLAMLIFWLLDIFVQFNTAVAHEGDVITSRKLVAKGYLRGRFWLDFLLVLLDVVTLVQPPQFSQMFWFRGIRAIRALRVLRAMRLATAQAALEDFLTNAGLEELLLFVALAQTLISIFLISHFMSCGWYMVAALEDGPTWLDGLDDAEPDDILHVYLHSYYWCLGHLTGGQIDPMVAPVTYIERVYTLLMVALSLIVVGANISNMTNAIADLQRANIEASDTRRKLTQMVRAANANPDLSARILRFGLYVFKRKSQLSLQTSMRDLLSTALASELTLSQRSPYLSDHPLFIRIKSSYPHVYLSLCEAFEPQIYAESDVIFVQGTAAEGLYITVRGEFRLEAQSSDFMGSAMSVVSERSQVDDDDDIGPVFVFSNRRWLCETSLFSPLTHRHGLRTTTFADAFTLRPEDFTTCAAKSPKFVAEIYHYATEYLKELNRRQTAKGQPLKLELTPTHLPHEICMKLDDKPVDTDVVISLNSPTIDPEVVADFIAKVVSNSFSADDMLEAMLPDTFGELRSPEGIYDGLGLSADRRRALAAMTSAIHLLQNNYDAFTARQNPRSRMSKELWEDMQRFVRWANLSREMIHAMLVFIAIRGIGKARVLLQSMERECRTPEDVVVNLMHNRTSKVPSVEQLQETEKQLIQQALLLHRSFNFMQLLQGENTPHHIATLKQLVKDHGTQILKFYLFSVVSVTCGLIAGESQLNGSVFMDQLNGANTMAGIHALLWLEQASPLSVYWGFIGERAQMLGARFRTLEDLAIARLACLTRTRMEDMNTLLTEWARVGKSDRDLLVHHLLADGLRTNTFVLTFLPDYLDGAKKNKAVGLYRGLTVLVELIHILASIGILETAMGQVVIVNISELATFTKEVKSAAVFMAVPGHASFVPKVDRLDCVVSAKHREQAGQAVFKDDPMQEMRNLLRRMDRRVGTMNWALERLYGAQYAPE